jgi:hypothetical protein
MGAKKAIAALSGIVLLAAFVLFISHGGFTQNYSTVDVIIDTPTPPPVIFGGSGSDAGGETPMATPTPTPPIATPTPDNSELFLGVYSDDANINVLTNIYWGSITPGSNTVKTVYFRNNGVLPFTISGVSLEDLIVKKAGIILDGNYTNYFSLSLDCVGVQLNPENKITSVLTLNIASNITLTEVTEFSFEVSVHVSA